MLEKDRTTVTMTNKVLYDNFYRPNILHLVLFIDPQRISTSSLWVQLEAFQVILHSDRSLAVATQVKRSIQIAPDPIATERATNYSISYIRFSVQQLPWISIDRLHKNILMPLSIKLLLLLEMLIVVSKRYV